MADNLERIVQQIAVEGTGEMGQAFEEVALLGEAAFERISKAAEGGQSFGKMALGLAGIGLAAGAAVYEISKFVNSQAQLVQRTVALADVTGMTTGQVRGLGDMFARAGMSTELFQRTLEQVTMRLANAAAQFNRTQALSGFVSEEQDQKIIESKLHVQDAMTNLTFASAEFSQKLRSDAISVGEAWVKLKFQSSDLSSQAQNDMLSVTGAKIGVEEAELNLKRLYTQQRINQYSPKSAIPFEMQSIQSAQDSIARDKAELAVKQAKQRELDAMSKSSKDSAMRPYAQDRAQLQYDQAKTTLAKDSMGTEVERATLDVAKARTANEKQILEIDIERARSAKGIMAQLAAGEKLSAFVGPHDVASALQGKATADAREQGTSAVNNLLHIVATEFQKGSFSSEMKEAIVKNLGIVGRSSSGHGVSAPEIVKDLSRGPEALDKQEASRVNYTQEQIASTAKTVQASNELNITLSQLKGAVADLIVSFVHGKDVLPTALNAIVDGIMSLFGIKPPSKQSEGAGESKMAEGGLVVGPGTGTSDSINARLSHGEHVTRAAAVKFWGTDFMDAINNMRLPGFAEGGMFGGVSLPGRFADAAGPGSMGTVNLSIDGKSFDGLRAPGDVMRQLSHYAIGRQTAATGRNPSWVR